MNSPIEIKLFYFYLKGLDKPYHKEDVCLFVCLSVPKDLAEPIGFSLTGPLLIGPGKVYNYFGGEASRGVAASIRKIDVHPL